VLDVGDRRTLAFTDDEFARDSREAVVFWGQDGDTRVRCRISREALDDGGDRLKPGGGSVRLRTLDVA
jgi:hypothetical protein